MRGTLVRGSGRRAGGGGALTRSTLTLVRALIGGALGVQAGVVVARLDGNGAAPTFLSGAVQNGDHDLSSGSEGDTRDLVRGAIDGVPKVEESITAGVAGRNDDNIIRTGGRVPSKGRRLALGECRSIDRKVSSDTDNGKSENDSGGKKSGEHRGGGF